MRKAQLVEKARGDLQKAIDTEDEPWLTIATYHLGGLSDQDRSVLGQ